MKIIHAIFSFNVGGAETMLVDILNQQCKEAFVSLIIVNNKLNADLINTIDKRVSIYLINREENNKFQLLPTLIKINQIVKRINPDIIHCHDNKLFPFFIMQQKKTLLTVHNTNLSCSYLKYYRQVFTVSEAVKGGVKKRANVDAQLVYNGIAIDEYEQRTDYIPQKLFKIVQISRLNLKQKGQHIAIQAVAHLKEKYPDMNFILYFVGDGEDKHKLNALAVKNKIENRIVFLGQKNRSWIKKHIQDFDVLIQPSLYEGFGLTIIEGLAAGLPVIASNLEGPKEILDFLNVGLTVKASNPNDLADKIYHIYTCYISDELLNHNYLIKYKSQLEPFDIKTTVSIYMEQYRSLTLNTKTV